MQFSWIDCRGKDKIGRYTFTVVEVCVKHDWCTFIHLYSLAPIQIHTLHTQTHTLSLSHPYTRKEKETREARETSEGEKLARDHKERD